MPDTIVISDDEGAPESEIMRRSENHYQRTREEYMEESTGSPVPTPVERETNRGVRTTLGPTNRRAPLISRFISLSIRSSNERTQPIVTSAPQRGQLMVVTADLSPRTQLNLQPRPVLVAHPGASEVAAVTSQNQSLPTPDQTRAGSSVTLSRLRGRGMPVRVRVRRYVARARASRGRGGICKRPARGTRPYKTQVTGRGYPLSYGAAAPNAPTYSHDMPSCSSGSQPTSSAGSVHHHEHDSQSTPLESEPEPFNGVQNSDAPGCCKPCRVYNHCVINYFGKNY